ncbi:ATP-binding protein [Halobacteria archaeon AArc-curdl1]|uniref:histidine kinase n=1 Tax=Natronosalvus hydrolyticus TaxID=2979988 RepID=A0AAP2ZDS6_9EURY|nr:ATP-binding protein [Halobacteria archaeon AArc-curdl1]
MEWQSTPYSLLLFLAGVTSLLWALYGLKIRRIDGPKPYITAFVVLSAAAAVWAVSYGVQLAIPTLEGKLTVYSFLHVGAVVVPPAWFAFAITYTGRDDWLTKQTVAGLLVVPLALLLAIPTNPYSLALRDVTIETQGSITVLSVTTGPLYLLYLGYSYVLLLAGLALIVFDTVRSPGPIKRQGLLLVTGASVPFVVNVLVVLNLPPLGTMGINLTPVSLALSSVLFGIAVVRYRLLDLQPIGWDVAMAQMEDGIVILDTAERVIDLNPAAKRLLGDRTPVVGLDAESVLPSYEQLASGEQVSMQVTESDGNDRVVQLTRSRLANDGVTYGWVIVFQDVTVLERQRQRLLKQNEHLDAFARVVSHDLRNPLTVIDGYTSLAEETGDPAHFQEVHETVGHMKTFLEDLLVLSQQGRTVTDSQPTALESVVWAAADALPDRSLDVQIDTDVILHADRKRLQQALDNLFRNACDHSEGAVTVTIGSLENGFYVEDDGPGIDDDALETVFETGYSTRKEGTGFGLAIVRDIVDAHGWAIEAVRGGGGGARFEITGVETGSTLESKY